MVWLRDQARGGTHRLELVKTTTGIPTNTTARETVGQKTLRLHGQWKWRRIGLFHWVKVCRTCGTIKPCMLEKWAHAYLKGQA